MPRIQTLLRLSRYLISSNRQKIGDRLGFNGASRRRSLFLFWKQRDHACTELFQYFASRTLAVLQIQDHVIHAARFQFSQEVDKEGLSQSKTEMDGSRSRVRIVRQIDIQRLCEGFEPARRDFRSRLPPFRGGVGLGREGTRIGDPSVTLRRDPFRRLAAAACDKHREFSRDRLGGGIYGMGRSPMAVEIWETRFSLPA